MGVRRRASGSLPRQIEHPAYGPQDLEQLRRLLRAAALKAILLAARIRTEGLDPLLELQLADGDAAVARAALQIVCESDGQELVDLALDAAQRLRVLS